MEEKFVSGSWQRVRWSCPHSEAIYSYFTGIFTTYDVMEQASCPGYVSPGSIGKKRLLRKRYEEKTTRD